jgi:two-component system sensor histidine kinase KdpD
VPETLPRVHADPGLLERAVANLVANALAWSPPDRRVEVTAGRLGDQSEAAFGRAFKRVTGIPPGAAKRSAPVDAASRW